MFAQYAGARTHFPGLFFLMATRKLSAPLFKSNCPATISSMISFTEKVGQTVFLTFHGRETVADDGSIGLGFIMLLSGEPGVGKTLTAECGALVQPDHRLIVSY